MLEREHLEYDVVQLVRQADSRTTYAWTLDVERAVSGGAARRRRARMALRAAGASLAVATLVVVTAVVGAGLGTSEIVIAGDVDEVPLTISALADSVPGEDLDPPIVDSFLGESYRGVLVHEDQASRPLQVWLLTTTDGDVCTAQMSADGSGSQGECLPRSRMLTEGVVSVSEGPAGSDFTMTVVLPDGYTTARVGDTSYVVDNNVAVIRTQAVPEGVLEVDGPGVPSVRWSTTDFWGPSWG